MSPLTKLLAKVGVAATFAASLMVWRNRHRESSQEAEINEFRLVVTYATDKQLVSLYGDYEMLVGLGASSEFTYKRDVCLNEMSRRAIVPPLRTSGGQSHREINVPVSKPGA